MVVAGKVAGEYRDRGGFPWRATQQCGVDGPGDIGLVPGELLQVEPALPVLAFAFSADLFAEFSPGDVLSIVVVKRAGTSAALTAVLEAGDSFLQFGDWQSRQFPRAGLLQDDLAVAMPIAPAAQGGIGQAQPSAELRGAVPRQLLSKALELVEPLSVVGFKVFFYSPSKAVWSWPEACASPVSSSSC